MSIILGPDGNTPIKSNLQKKTYKAGGLRIQTELTPDMMLSKAAQGAGQLIWNQVFEQTMRSSGSAVEAHQAARAATVNVDPFTLEPSAMAVFMYLSREIEYRDRIIDQINDRLRLLGSDPIDMTHPYPDTNSDDLQSL